MNRSGLRTRLNVVLADEVCAVEVYYPQSGRWVSLAMIKRDKLAELWHLTDMHPNVLRSVSRREWGKPELALQHVEEAFFASIPPHERKAWTEDVADASRPETIRIPLDGMELVINENALTRLIELLDHLQREPSAVAVIEKKDPEQLPLKEKAGEEPLEPVRLSATGKSSLPQLRELLDSLIYTPRRRVNDGWMSEYQRTEIKNWEERVGKVLRAMKKVEGDKTLIAARLLAEWNNPTMIASTLVPILMYWTDEKELKQWVEATARGAEKGDPTWKGWDHKAVKDMSHEELIWRLLSRKYGKRAADRWRPLHRIECYEVQQLIVDHCGDIKELSADKVYNVLMNAGFIFTSSHITASLTKLHNTKRIARVKRGVYRWADKKAA